MKLTSAMLELREHKIWRVAICYEDQAQEIAREFETKVTRGSSFAWAPVPMQIVRAAVLASISAAGGENSP